VYLQTNHGELEIFGPSGSVTASATVGANGASFIATGADGIRYVGSSAALFAVAPTGATKWTFPFAGSAPSAQDELDAYADIGAPTIGSDGTIYVSSWAGVVNAIRPDGSKKWSLDLGETVAGSPALGADGTLYVGGHSHVIAISPVGSMKWVYPVGAVARNVSVSADGTIYAGAHDVYALGEDGTLKWSYAGSGSLAPVVDDVNGGVVASVWPATGKSSVLRLTKQGTLAWETPLEAIGISPPTLDVQGTAYVATGVAGQAHAATALSLNGAVVWTVTLEPMNIADATVIQPVLGANGRLHVASEQSAVFALSD
jgi:outer membrane protein assembly factor BamB